MICNLDGQKLFCGPDAEINTEKSIDLSQKVTLKFEKLASVQFQMCEAPIDIPQGHAL